MSVRKALRLMVDAAMCGLMLFMMSYPLTRGLSRHGICGLGLVFLVIVHHLLNGGWYRTFLRGRSRGRRLLLTVTDALLMAVFLIFLASAAGMAGDTYAFLPFRMPFWSRALHTAATAWLFVTAAFHPGLHGGVFRVLAERLAGRARRFLYAVLFPAGGCCFVQSPLWSDMLFLGEPKFWPGGLPEFPVQYAGAGLFFCVLGRLLTLRRREALRSGRNA